MAKLILLRHLKSQWNQDNRFAGWVDNPLSKEGILQAKEIADRLSITDINVVYTSPLIRNEETVLRVFENMNKQYPVFKHFEGKASKWENFEGQGNYIAVYVSESLNERYYGKLQGLNKDEIKQKYGEEKVHLWRRDFKTAPLGGESLKDVYKRTVPFYQKYIEKDLKNQKNVLVVASHNSLRTLVKYIEGISDENISSVELPFGALLEYEFDADLSLRSKKYFV